MKPLPSTFVVDASAGIQLFIPEEHTQDVQALFEQSLTSPDDSLYVPDLFFIECANILWKKVRRGEYPEAAAMENLADLNALELPSTPTAELMERALELACRYGVTAYDACYIALAERREVPLLTADSRLAEKISGGQFNICLLSD